MAQSRLKLLATGQLSLSLLLLLIFMHFCEVSDDVRATVFVNSHVTFFHHLIHTVDRKLSKLLLLFTCIHFLLQLLDLFELLL